MITIAERRKIAKLVMTIHDENVVDKIKSILSTATKAAKDKYIEQYNREIDEAVKRVDRGEYYTEEQANALLEKWQKEKLAGIKKLGKSL